MHYYYTYIAHLGMPITIGFVSKSLLLFEGLDLINLHRQVFQDVQELCHGLRLGVW